MVKMYAMDYMIEGIHTLAAFSEMLDIFDYIGSILRVNSSSEALTTNENEDKEDTLNNVSSKLSEEHDSVDKKTQIQDIIKNGALQIKLEETSISAPSSETLLKITNEDTSSHLNKPISENAETSVIESSGVPAQTITDKTHDGSHQAIESEEDYDRAIPGIESDRTNLESNAGEHNNRTKVIPDLGKIEKVVKEENNRQLGLEENFNQYEVFTETCKFVPNNQSPKLSNGPDKSQLEPILVANELNQNEVSLLKSHVEKEYIHSIKIGQKEEINSSANAVHTNEVQLQLNGNGFIRKIDPNDSLEVKKKFITSSWDLVSIVKLLYAIPEPQAPKTHTDERMLQTKVLLLPKGAFSQYPQGVYDILVEENKLTVLQDDESILSFSLTHAEISLDTEEVIRMDNKMGRTLYVKCNSKSESLQMMESLQTISFNCRQPECINLVHYPLKCYQNIIVIDLGSCSTRAGILMDQPTLPTLFFPSVCATDKTTGKSEYGMEALQTSKRQNSTISFPIRPSQQIIKHNIDVEKVTGIFKKIFKQLRVDPENYTVQVCLPRSLSISAQNALVKVLLEDLNVKAVSLAHQAILTMYAHNVSTGVVVDVGDRMDIMTVIDGFIVESGVTRLPYGGQRLIHHMKHALAQKHISLSNEIDSFVVQYITENLSYIALDYETEQDIATAHPEIVRKSVDLQSFAKDESCLQCATLEEARFKVPEGLFNPDLWGLDFPGIHKLVQKAIQAAGVDTRKKVAENIYVSGGVTLIPGFVDRLRKEVTKLNEPRITPKVFASDYRYHCTFIGACRFARMDVFPQVCISKQEYRNNPQTALKKFALCI